MKIALFSLVPPERSGIADYTALLLPALRVSNRPLQQLRLLLWQRSGGQDLPADARLAAAQDVDRRGARVFGVAPIRGSGGKQTLAGLTDHFRQSDVRFGVSQDNLILNGLQRAHDLERLDAPRLGAI